MPTVSRGSLFRRRHSPNWIIKFYIDGRPCRETAGTPDREAAEAFLVRPLDEARRGLFRDVSERVTFTQMKELLLRNNAFKRNRTDPSRFVDQLATAFGRLRGEEITEERVAEHSRQRLERDHVAPATLHRELSVLRRMLRLASHRLPRVPVIDMPRVHNARQGFFEEDDLQALLPHLPPHARNLVEFLYLTGWRVGEVLRLRWSDVDWKRRSVWLRDSKSREPRVFPFKYHPRLEQVLRRQRQFVTEWERAEARLCASVFPWRGRPMQKLRRSWKTACRAAGLPDRLVHDFRRTAVRNLIRAGVQQAIAMKITGHKTGSIFRRYLIVDEELLAQATGPWRITWSKRGGRRSGRRADAAFAPADHRRNSESASARLRRYSGLAGSRRTARSNSSRASPIRDWAMRTTPSCPYPHAVAGPSRMRRSSTAAARS
jgi:integrase